MEDHRVRAPLSIRVGDAAELRKPHACGGKQWVVTSTGVDVRARCVKCGRSVLMARTDFERAAKRVTPGQRGQPDPSATPSAPTD